MAGVELGRYDGVDRPSNPFLISMNVTTIVTNLLIGAIAFNSIYYAIDWWTFSSFYPQHIYLCVIGYIIVMTQAIFAINPHGGWAQSFNYDQKSDILLVMQIIGSVLAIAGSSLCISNHPFNFRSAHGICGLITLILTFLSLAAGIGNLISRKINNNFPIIKAVHSYLLSFTLVFAFITLLIAFDSMGYRLSQGQQNANLSVALTFFAMIGTVLVAWPGILRKMFCC